MSFEAWLAEAHRGMTQALLPRDPRHRQIVTVALALLHGRAERGAGVDPTDITPGVMGELRRELCERRAPWLLREEALSLIRALPLALQNEACDYPVDGLLDLSRRLNPPSLLGLLRAGWGGMDQEEAKERAELFGLALEEVGAQGDVLDPWVGAEQLDPSDPDAPRIANELRWLRVNGAINNRWAAWARLPALTAPRAGGRLVWSMALPGAPPPDLAPLGLDIPLRLTMADVAHARGAQARRRLAVKRIAEALGAGQSVAWLANSTTIDSRRAVIAAAREARADIVAIYHDIDPAQLETEQRELGWQVSPRVIRRSVDVLEGPRPHEAERLFVVRDGAAVSVCEATAFDGWRMARRGVESA